MFQSLDVLKCKFLKICHRCGPWEPQSSFQVLGRKINAFVPKQKMKGHKQAHEKCCKNVSYLEVLENKKKRFFLSMATFGADFFWVVDRMLDNEATELVRAKPNPLNFLSQNSMVSLGILWFGDDFRERS